MEGPPARVVWAKDASETYKTLSFKVQDQIDARIEVLRRHPKMYQVETFGRWEGLRRFPVERFKVFYEYWSGDHTIYVEAVVSI